MNPISHGIQQHTSVLGCVRRLLDAVAVSATLLIALQATPTGAEAGHSLMNEWLIISAAAVLVLHAASEVTGLYRSWRGDRLQRELTCIVITWAYVIAALLGLGLVSQYNVRFTYETKVAWILGAPFTMVMLRIVIRSVQKLLHRNGFNTRRIAICGVNDLGVQLARNLSASPGYGLRIAGFYDDRLERGEQKTPSGNDPSQTTSRADYRLSPNSSRTAEAPLELCSTTGSIDQLVSAAKRGEIDSVYITFPMRAEDRIREVLNRLSDTTASVYIVPDFFVFELLHARWTNIDGLPAVSVHENPLYGVDGLLKRAADLAGAALLLAFLSVPMALVALAVKLTSRGPVFFRQKRYGLDGKEILVWKYRSMRTQENGARVKQATKNDDRITPLGRVLRRTSLDELPQLFNVIGGSMSLVGPRPHATAHNEQYRSLIDGYMLRHKVKPGITGLAQVMGFRGETETLEKMEGRVRYDHQYIREWSLLMDIKILLRTVLVVMKQENAY